MKEYVANGFLHAEARVWHGEMDQGTLTDHSWATAKALLRGGGSLRHLNLEALMAIHGAITRYRSAIKPAENP